MSNTSITYFLGAVVGVASISLWAWLVAAPAWGSYPRLWQRLVSVVLSVYVLVAMLAAGGLIGGLFLWYYDRLG